MNLPSDNQNPLPYLGDEEAANLTARLRDAHRQQFGNFQTIIGHLNDSDITERVVLTVDLCTGSAAVMAWSPA